MTKCSLIAAEILGYMVENPNAQDSFEGIVEWWLLEHHIRRQTLRVRRALAELVEMGFVVESGPPEQRRYSLNRARWREIVELCRNMNEA